MYCFSNSFISPAFVSYHFSVQKNFYFPFLSSAPLFLYYCGRTDFLIHYVITHNYYYSFRCSNGSNMTSGNIPSSQFLYPSTYPYHSLNTSLLPGTRCPKISLNLCCLRPGIALFLTSHGINF